MNKDIVHPESLLLGVVSSQYSSSSLGSIFKSNFSPVILS
jgi:hypothetical protein